MENGRNTTEGRSGKFRATALEGRLSPGRIVNGHAPFGDNGSLPAEFAAPAKFA
jgi:hypothetical protein